MAHVSNCGFPFNRLHSVLFIFNSVLFFVNSTHYILIVLPLFSSSQILSTFLLAQLCSFSFFKQTNTDKDRKAEMKYGIRGPTAPEQRACPRVAGGEQGALCCPRVVDGTQCHLIEEN